MKRTFAIIVAVLGLVFHLPGAAAAQERMLVFAAASLQDVLNEIADDYVESGGARPVLSFAASSTLARQIEHGAPTALFISADEDWMDYLAARDKIEAKSRRTLLGNSLVLITPAGEGRMAEISPNFDLVAFLDGRRLAMGDPAGVPVGRYGRAALQYYGLWDDVARQVVRADNVRSALAFVERGEVAAGIVYKTDALAAKGVEIAAEFPAESHAPVRYPVALMKGAGADARAFLRFLESEPARATFDRFGFTAP